MSNTNNSLLGNFCIFFKNVLEILRFLFDPKICRKSNYNEKLVWICFVCTFLLIASTQTSLCNVSIAPRIIFPENSVATEQHLHIDTFFQNSITQQLSAAKFYLSLLTLRPKSLHKSPKDCFGTISSSNSMTCAACSTF